jgi:Fe-S-cluster containining protein
MILAKLSRALGLGDDPAPILERMRALYDEVDRDVAKESAGLELPCKAGCDACCHEAVFLSAPEFLVVASHLIEHRTQEELRALLAEMSVLAERFEDELLLLEELTAGSERDEVAARVKFRCPLLGADGCCTIYPARELNARTFGLTWDSARGHPFGCELTHGRLRVLPPEVGPRLFDAREARRKLVAVVPGTERVRVYPWWFARHGSLLVP